MLKLMLMFKIIMNFKKMKIFLINQMKTKVICYFRIIIFQVTPDTYKSGQALKNVFYFDIKLIFIKLYTVR
jgi:hypothetical protein